MHCSQHYVCVSFCPADVQQLLTRTEAVPSEQQQWRFSPDQEDPPELPHIKEEQEEDLWSSQRESSHAVQFPSSAPVPVKSEEDDEEPESSQQHLTSRPCGRTEAEPGGTDCGGPEPARYLDPHSFLQHLGDEKVSNSNSEPETEISEDECKETAGPQPDLISANNKGPTIEVTFNAGKKSFICSECGRKFGRKDSLRRHMRYHTGEKPYSCSVCGKRFSQRPNLIRHMRCHSGEKPFSCSFCDTSFAVRSALVNHMRIHTGEKPFSCVYCEKSFTQKGGLKKHMTVHTGEKPYSCPVCDKSFSQKANLTYHFSVHTGQKQFSCSVCDKRFTWQSQVKSHKCVGESSSNN